MVEILQNYLDYLRTQNYAQKSINTYYYNLKTFFEFIQNYMSFKSINKFSLLQIKESDIRAYLVYCSFELQNNPYTREKKIVAIRMFYKWLENEFKSDLFINPTTYITNIKKVERLPKYLSIEEAKKVSNIFDEKNDTNYKRDNMIVSILLVSGIRISELTNIRVQNINFSENTIVIKGKGNQERLVYLSSKCMNKLQTYINDNNIQNYVFNLSIRTIEYIVKKAFKLADIDEKYSAHTLRHTSATLMYKQTKDILLVKKFLGHKSLESTQVYTHIYNEDVKNAVERNPLSNFMKEGERVAKN